MERSRSSTSICWHLAMRFCFSTILLGLTCTIFSVVQSTDQSRPNNRALTAISSNSIVQNVTTTKTNHPYFPDSQLVLDMAILSNAVYHLHKHKVESCHDEQAKNRTLINHLLEDESITTNNNFMTNTNHIDDIYKLLLPNATCLHYSHDYTLGTQVLVVRSKLYNYVAVAYAGTDDYKTALTDGDILTSELGPSVNSTDEGKNDLRSIFDKNVPKNVRVHRGFNSNVFDSEDYRKVLNCISSARLGGDCDGSSSTITTNTSNILSDYSTKTAPSSIQPYEIFTTGHSLGAANSVLLGAALHLYYPNEAIRSINFGCPKVGNVEWGMYINSLQPEDEITEERTEKGKIGKGSFEIFRFVNKIDLVPRLPELPLLIHVGHTLQMSIGGVIRAYYDHLGNETLNYAGVPFGWEAAPYAFLPGALDSHPSKHYVAYLDFYKPNCTNTTINMTTNLSSMYYVKEFEPVEKKDQEAISSYA